MRNTLIYINTINLNILIIKTKTNTQYLYIYNQFIYYCHSSALSFFFNENSNCLVLTQLYTPDTANNITFFFKNFWKNWNNFFFQKIKFTGKGYKIKKKKKSIKFFFGRSHLTIIFFNKTLIKRLTKYKLFFCNKNQNILIKIKKFLNKIRALNIFTKRGLRFMRQNIKKKTGKKSTYM